MKIDWTAIVALVGAVTGFIAFVTSMVTWRRTLPRTECDVKGYVVKTGNTRKYSVVIFNTGTRGFSVRDIGYAEVYREISGKLEPKFLVNIYNSAIEPGMFLAPGESKRIEFEVALTVKRIDHIYLRTHDNRTFSGLTFYETNDLFVLKHALLQAIEYNIGRPTDRVANNYEDVNGLNVNLIVKCQGGVPDLTIDTSNFSGYACEIFDPHENKLGEHIKILHELSNMLPELFEYRIALSGKHHILAWTDNVQYLKTDLEEMQSFCRKYGVIGNIESFRQLERFLR